MTGVARLCLSVPEGNTVKKEMICVGFDIRSLAEKKEKMEPISFPVKNGDKETSEFFRILEIRHRITYNYGKGIMYLIDNTDGEHPDVKTIPHEDFARAVRQGIPTSAEMLLLLSLSYLFPRYRI